MSGYSDSALSGKLGELNNSAPSIQGVSLWLLHHRKHYRSSVQVWHRELTNVRMDKKLTLLYLANDVVQNARKKYPEVGKEFGSVLGSVFSHLAGLDLDRKTVGSIGRLVNIWRERQIFEQKVLQEVSTIWAGKLGRALEGGEDTEPNPPPAKKAKQTSSDTVERTKVDSEVVEKNDVDPSNSEVMSKVTSDIPAVDNNVETPSSKCSECRRSLMLALAQMDDVERAESLVSGTTQRIARLEDGGEAVSLLGELTHQLAGELLARSRLSQLVAGVLARQQDLVGVAEQKLVLAREQLEKFSRVQQGQEEGKT